MRVRESERECVREVLTGFNSLHLSVSLLLLECLHIKEGGMCVPCCVDGEFARRDSCLAGMRGFFVGNLGTGEKTSLILRWQKKPERSQQYDRSFALTFEKYCPR